MTETEIASLAVSLIGGKSLTALDTDNTPQAASCRKWFDPARDEALASHPWNFAAKRWRNEIAWTALSGVALADAGASDEIRVTATSHGLVTGDRVHIKEAEGVTNANGTWYVTRIDANNFDLDDSVFSGSHTSGTGSWVKAPLFGWDYQHTLPTDCLRVVNLNGYEANENDSIPYAVELGKLLCNESIVTMRYVYKNETCTEWSQHFINSFSLLLASYIAQDLTGPSGKAAELRARFEQQISPKAKTQDSRQGKGRVIDPDYDSRVVAARRGYSL